MCDDLEDFYVKLQDLDHWLDEAIEKTGELKGAKDGVDSQFTVFKVITVHCCYIQSSTKTYVVTPH